MTKSWRYLFIFLILSLVLVVVANFQIGDDKLHLVICNVGQGDGILIYKKDKQIVMDGGPDDSILSCLSRHTSFWDREIETVILTNPDSDHYTGFIDLLKRYKVDNYIAPELAKDDSSFRQLEAEVEKQKLKGMKVTYGFAGQVVLASQGDALELKLDDLWPTRDWYAGEVDGLSLSTRSTSIDSKSQVLGTWSAVGKGKIVNELSLVYLLKYGDFKALLTGDVQPPAADNVSLISQIGQMGPISVLKVPHHGSKNGLTQSMLDAAKPKLAIISVGKHNRYGHPDQETLSLLQNAGVKTLRTDQDGEVEIVTDGKSWRVK